MTIFNYLVNKLTAQPLFVPHLLNGLISGSRFIPFSVPQKHVAGYIAHLLVGILFALIFYLIFRFTAMSPGWLSGAILGFLAGLAGITGWKILFTLNPNPPQTNLSKFFLQLVIAHVFFGIGVVAVYLIA